MTGATGYRGPEPIHRLSHGGIVLLALPLSAIFAVRLRRGRVGRADALALLALLLFLRGLLDPWNSIYYVLPAILVLVSWEALSRPGLPVGAMALGSLTWLTFVAAPDHLGPGGGQGPTLGPVDVEVEELVERSLGRSQQAATA